MQLNGSEGFSLYFHIPFCSKKCDYCHFYVIPNQPRFQTTYIKALKKEWQLRMSMLPIDGLISIYFGGGTPALLESISFEEIISWIPHTSNCEITVEANPENITLEKLKELRTLGINRISLGVQSLDDYLLKSLSRTHSALQAIQAIEHCHNAGFDNISIDLMYDLPGQTLESWQRTCSHACSLPISHLSLYNLTIEPHTVFYKKRKQLKLPSDEMSLKMLECAIAQFESAEFERYEISAFARGGKISQHNTGYWTGRPFIGFGPSACSYWKGSRLRNIANLNRYASSLEQSCLPVDFEETLTEKERLKELLAIRLRLIKGLPLSSQLVEHFGNQIAQLCQASFATLSDKTLRLTEKGVLFHDTVAEEIMSW